MDSTTAPPWSMLGPDLPIAGTDDVADLGEGVRGAGEHEHRRSRAGHHGGQPTRPQAVTSASVSGIASAR